MTTALYRRYRPDTFQDVIGQDHVTFPLMAALRGDRVTHAYLFSGPRGCGKTTSARILARCLNCEQAPTDTPCGQCPSCRDLATGGPGSLDVVEIDAASHNGVDDARDLRERAAFAPARDRYKIFILDEAHMVTPQGFNALLKLVEEPPAHVKFVFATTEPEKVIGTIRSRTHHYPFRLVPPDLLEGYLAQLCQTEHVEVGPGVFPLVTRAGGGSVRDTLSVMDQLIGGALDGSVDYQRAVALLGYTDTALLDQCVDAIAAADGAGVFRVVDRVVSSGHDPRRFVEDLLQRLRDLLVISLAGEQAGPALGSRPADELSRMEVQARTLGGVALSRAADATSTALGQMVGATSPRLQLELLMARLLVPTVGSAVAQAAGAVAGSPARGAAAPGVRQAPEAPAAGGLKERPVPPAGQALTGAAASRDGRGQPGRPGRGPVPPGRGAVAAEPERPEPAWGTEAPGSPDRSGGVPPAAASRPARASSETGVRRPGGERPVSGGAASAPDRSGARAPGKGVPEGASPAQAAVPAGPNPFFIRDSREPAPAPAPAPASAPAAGAAEAEMIRQRWGEVLEAVKRERRMSWALVSPYGQPGTLEGGVFSLLLPSAGLISTFDKGGHAGVVASALYQALGVQAQVRAVLSGGDGGPGGPGDSGPSPGPGGPSGSRGQASQAGGGWGGSAPAAPGDPGAPGPAHPPGGQGPGARQAVREHPDRHRPEPETPAATTTESGARTGAGLSPAARAAEQVAYSKTSAVSPAPVPGPAPTPDPATDSAPAPAPDPAPTLEAEAAAGRRPAPKTVSSPARCAAPDGRPSLAHPPSPARRDGSARAEAPAGTADATGGSATVPRSSSPPRSTPEHDEDPGFNPWYEQESAWETPPPPEDWSAPVDDAAPWSGGQAAADSGGPGEGGCTAAPAPGRTRVSAQPGVPASPPSPTVSAPVPQGAADADQPARGAAPHPAQEAPAPSSEPETHLASVHRLHALPDLPPAPPSAPSPTQPEAQDRRPRLTVAHRESPPAQPARFSPLAPVSWDDAPQAPAAPEPAGDKAAPATGSPSTGAATSPTPLPAAARAAAQVRSLAASRPAVPLEEDLPSKDDEDAEEAGTVGIEVVKRLLGAVVIEEVVVTQEDS